MHVTGYMIGVCTRLYSSSIALSRDSSCCFCLTHLARSSSDLLPCCLGLAYILQTMDTDQSAAPLLQLPDPCLVAVLRCCSGDPRSVCSAARAHSRLRQAAGIALSSITAAHLDQQRL